MPSIDDIIPMPAEAKDLPDPEPFYYVQGGDGLYIMKRTLFGNALVPTDNPKHLPASPALLWKKIPKLPADLIGQAWSFFRETYAQRGSEAMVYITHKDGTYRLFVPRQTASISHVNAELDPSHIAEGWMVAGTIHSHCDFSAFHSGTDQGDAKDHDGLHITIGHVNTIAPSIEAMVSVSGVNWPVKLDEYSDGTLALHDHPAHWSRYIVGQVKRPAPITGQILDDDWASDYRDWKPVEKFKGSLGTKTPSWDASHDKWIARRKNPATFSVEDGFTEGDDMGFESIDEAIKWAHYIDMELNDLRTELENRGISAHFSLTYLPSLGLITETRSTDTRLTLAD